MGVPNDAELLTHAIEKMKCLSKEMGDDGRRNRLGLGRGGQKLSFSQAKCDLSQIRSSGLTKCYPEDSKTHAPKRYSHTDGHSSSIHSGQHIEATEASYDR